MKLDPIIFALRMRCPVLENRVAGAAEWAGLTEDEDPQTPAAYVIPLREEAGENDSAVGYYQVITNHFAVIVLLSNVRDERGQCAYERLDEVRTEILRGILSWQQEPRDEHSEIVYRGGELIHMDDYRLCFQYDFSFETYLGTEDTWQGVELDSLEPIEGADVRVDCIDPSTEKLKPDGQIEATLKVEL